MKVKNIEQLKKCINRSTVLIFIIIFSSAMTGLYFTHYRFIQKRALLNKQEINSAGEIYKSNLSEKLSIIASSAVFLDYLRSGAITREKLYPQFLAQVATLRTKSISGMEILDNDRETIFNLGLKTRYFVTLKLCYMNETLDSRMGDCQFYWKLYFDLNLLTNAIPVINKSIKLYNNRNSYNFINNDHFGSFHVFDYSQINLPYFIQNESDYFFYINILLITITLIIFGSLSWYRLSSLLNNYIALPINNLISCLKSDAPFENHENVDEIKFLINEINLWKIKLSKMQSDENSVKLANIAAQLAHDVRSPLSAINMLIKNINNIPENFRVALHNSIQRISDIANNFLFQYKSPNEITQGSILSSEYIPGILESIVSEKINQYFNRDIKFIFSLENNAWDTFGFINSVDFKRVISNLINNSVEAINHSGTIAIKLSKSNNTAGIEIIDDGSGISAVVLDKVIHGGVSIGKANGFGLGLSHAINTIKSWNGFINIKSEVGKGTIVGITFPLSNQQMSDIFKFSLSFSSKQIICIIDDEVYTHDIWTEKLKHIRNDHIKHFYSIDETETFLTQTKNSDIIFLVDYDLGNNQFTGLDFIRKYNIQHCSTLITNRYDDPKIHKLCMSYGVKLIPKNLITYVPIES